MKIFINNGYKDAGIWGIIANFAHRFNVYDKNAQHIAETPAEGAHHPCFY